MKINNSNVCGLLGAFVVMAAVTYCSNSRAETAIWAGAWSKHVVTGHQNDYTSSHDLVAIERDRWLVARYRNSYSREAYAVGYGKAWSHGDIRLSAYVGATSGYTSWGWGDDGDSSVIQPMLVGAAHYTRHRVQPGVIVFGEAVALSVRVEIY